MGPMANNLALNVPQIINAGHTHSLYQGDGSSIGMGLVNTNAYTAATQRGFMMPTARENLQQVRQEVEQLIKQETETMADPKRRFVKVIIIDPDEKVPLEQCVLYSGDEKLTDLNDQELFFEIEIKALLDAHNAERIKIIDKTVKERTEVLEPIKVRDLRMVVVTVAQF